MKKQIPVYLFIGFLEGGKTHMIQESMEDERFNSGEKTMIISCEEGIDEYDISRFWGKNVYIENIENEEDVTHENLNNISKKHIIDRIIVEYNGMWQLDTLFMNMPENWDVYQCVMSAECATFELFNANMRSLMFDKLSACEMLVLNRATPDADRENIHKIVRGVNPRCEIVYDFPDGRIEYDDIEDELPFDIDAPVIEIDDKDYAIWYRDMSEDLEKYNGKTVKFKGLVARDPQMSNKSIIIGRHVMT
jgi:G3E family GTPase